MSQQSDSEIDELMPVSHPTQVKRISRKPNNFQQKQSIGMTKLKDDLSTDLVNDSDFLHNGSDGLSMQSRSKSTDDSSYESSFVGGPNIGLNIQQQQELKDYLLSKRSNKQGIYKIDKNDLCDKICGKRGKLASKRSKQLYSMRVLNFLDTTTDAFFEKVKFKLGSAPNRQCAVFGCSKNPNANFARQTSVCVVHEKEILQLR